LFFCFVLGSNFLITFLILGLPLGSDLTYLHLHEGGCLVG
jgi:hypothetical protein